MAKAKASTREDLIEAATAEFFERGYEATNTNAIARRAGYAPQTFYRHFKDKLEIFLVVYDRWAEHEIDAIANAGSLHDLITKTVAHHAGARVFRQSLRDLTARVPHVAQARANSRRRQLATLARRVPAFAFLPGATQASGLLIVERLCDALVEGEFAALDVAEEQVVEFLCSFAGGLGLKLTKPS